jgi:hypothetical protein
MPDFKLIRREKKKKTGKVRLGLRIQNVQFKYSDFKMCDLKTQFLKTQISVS